MSRQGLGTVPSLVDPHERDQHPKRYRHLFRSTCSKHSPRMSRNDTVMSSMSPIAAYETATRVPVGLHAAQTSMLLKLGRLSGLVEGMSLAKRNEVARTKCRWNGTVPIDRRWPGSFNIHGGWLRNLADYDGREMPSFCILDWRVVRFMPSLAAAPAGPPMVQFVLCSALRICSRSAYSRVVVPESAV